MSHIAPGRHRAPGRFNPLAELTLMAKESAQPAVKGAAIVAASGGLVASFAAPSYAADGGAVVAAAGTTAAGSAAVGPLSSAAAGSTALSSVGYVSPAAARPAAPIVIEDILVKNQRAQAAARLAATAKAEATTRARVEAAAQEKARAKAAAKARAEAAASRQAAPARASRSTSRTAVTSTATRSTVTRSTATRSTATRSTVTRSTPKTAPKRVNPAPPPVRAQSASGIAGIAQSLFGIPYVYGGTSTRGFDCSGYTQYVYARAGVSIPRTASAQQRAASRVSSPRPGDLVFFGTPAYHVGIYVSPGRLADAQRPGSVTGNHSIWTTPSGYGRF